jgi:tetratricopeptide (TPR) repeat protein
MNRLYTLALAAVLAFVCTAQANPAFSQASPPSGLTAKAYSQIQSNDFAGATRTLSEELRKNGDNVTARRYLAYALLEQGLAKEALQQLNSLPFPVPYDLFMKGKACEAIPDTNASIRFYLIAVRGDPRNDTFRKKAIEALIQNSQYNDAVRICSEGARVSTSGTARKFYIEQLKQAKALSETIEKSKTCTAPPI